MKRKVIQIANSTQLVSLPRKWTQKYGVKKGDEIEVEERGNKICIFTEKAREMGNIEINITGLDRDSLMFLIRCLYIKGYDEIKVNFDEPIAMHYRVGQEVNVLKSIHEEVNRLTGVEIIQQRENFCIIKDISESNIKDFEVVLRRIFLLVIDASNDLLEGTKKSDKYLLESLQEKHNTITKFIANNLRLLNKFGYDDRNNLILYHIIYTLDNIIDRLKEASRYIVNHNVKFSKETENLLQVLHTMLVDFQSMYFKFDLKLAEKISRVRYDSIENLNKISKKISSHELILLTKMLNVADKVLDLSVNRMIMEY